MSIVVYDARTREMTADTRAYSGSTHPVGHKHKIHRIASGPYQGSLVGICSNMVGMPEEFRAWIERGAERTDYAPSDPSFEAILVKPNGDVFLFNDAYYAAGPMVGDFFTIGSGRKYAYAAMKCGRSATEAIEIAVECDPWCGLPVDVLKLESEPVSLPVDVEEPELPFGAESDA